MAQRILAIDLAIKFGDLMPGREKVAKNVVDSLLESKLKRGVKTTLRVDIDISSRAVDTAMRSLRTKVIVGRDAFEAFELLDFATQSMKQARFALASEKQGDNASATVKNIFPVSDTVFTEKDVENASKASSVSFTAILESLIADYGEAVDNLADNLYVYIEYDKALDLFLTTNGTPLSGVEDTFEGRYDSVLFPGSREFPRASEPAYRKRFAFASAYTDRRTLRFSSTVFQKSLGPVSDTFFLVAANKAYIPQT